MGTTQIDLPRSWRCRGETLTGTRRTYTADSAGGPDYTVPAGSKKLGFDLPITKSQVSMFFWFADKTVTFHFNGVNEVQSVTITGSPTGGTFTLTYSGQTTAGIAYNAAASAVQAALEALSNIAVGDVSVSGSAGGPWSVEFTGDLGLADVSAMTASGASLTGGTSPGVTIATPTPGVAPDVSWDLSAGQPEDFDAASIHTNPMPGDLVRAYFTNAGAVGAKVQLRFGLEA